MSLTTVMKPLSCIAVGRREAKQTFIPVKNLTDHYFMGSTWLPAYCRIVEPSALVYRLLEVITHPPTVGTFCNSWAFPKM